jgi:fused signal recognition particle receptor
MAEKRGGFFQRMFGGDAPAEPAKDTPADALAAPPAEAAPKRSWLERLRSGLSRSANALTGNIGAIFTRRKLDAATLEEFEDTLIQADLGVDASAAIAEALGQGRYGKELEESEVRAILAAEIERLLTPVARPFEIDAAKKPHVVLVVGVNGTGKTTTIGKLAARYAGEGKRVVLAAGDTFRAAAIEQLTIWGSRTGASVVARDPGSDAASLAFDALRQAQAEGADLLLIDTAGRLQNRTELMAELEKIVRVIRKQDASAPHSVLLTLDATTGQNALSQVEIFGKVAGVTGLVMTKLDGTARGGILVAIAGKFGLPVHFIGVGESADDLEPFTAADFAKAIAGT